MAVLDIVSVADYPAEIQPIDVKLFNGELFVNDQHMDILKESLGDMVETLAKYQALGLAAPQVGIPYKFALGRDNTNGIILMINPEIFPKGSRAKFREGCLTVPGDYQVKRYKSVKCRYWTFNDTKDSLVPVDTSFRGTAALVAQHETDHLEGILLTERGERVWMQ